MASELIALTADAQLHGTPPRCDDMEAAVAGFNSAALGVETAAMKLDTKVYPDPKQTAEACAQHILNRLEEALAKESLATLAISGGSTPRLMFNEMARRSFPWERLHLFWVDERAVPPTDPQSNYKMAAEALIGPAGIPARNVHRIEAELGPEEAATRYTAEIRSFFGLTEGSEPRFDVMHRGMGPDAHTASLFPGEPLIDGREGWIAAVYAKKMNQWRITMLPRILLAARQTVMLVTGGDKAAPLREVAYCGYDPKRLPAQIAVQTGNEIWFLDRAAASLLD